MHFSGGHATAVRQRYLVKLDAGNGGMTIVVKRRFEIRNLTKEPKSCIAVRNKH